MAVPVGGGDGVELGDPEGPAVGVLEGGVLEGDGLDDDVPVGVGVPVGLTLGVPVGLALGVPLGLRLGVPEADEDGLVTEGSSA